MPLTAQQPPRRTDASKIAFAHLASLGAKLIPRAEFIERLQQAKQQAARIE